MLSVATWNINSVRLRIEHVVRFLAETNVDVLCLQELKAATDRFPAAALIEAGYPHHVVVGQPGYNGVAVVSRRPLRPAGVLSFCGRDDARHAAVELDGEGGPITLHGLYVPSGGDEPDPEANDKFAHKLAFLDEMAERLAAERRALLVGDLNVAPLETDVWSHRQMLKVVSHTPVETDKLQAAAAAGGWVDTVRAIRGPEEKVFSWWSYRARDWRASNRGRRLDHIWATPDIADTARSAQVFDQTRDWEKPSDHVPVIVAFDL